MKTYHVLTLLALSFQYSCNNPKDVKLLEHDKVKVDRIEDGVYIHTSYLRLSDNNYFPSNGMVITDDKEAIVIDTPVDDTASAILINWIRDELKCSIKTLVCTHFHVDCLGGLGAFHREGIQSLAYYKTLDFAKEKGNLVPQKSFDKTISLSVGERTLDCLFAGEGHTQDNIVVYDKSAKLLFGGCLVKEMGAGRGNLKDANVKEWSRTISRLKLKFPEVEKVIPGHGLYGGIELLNYTEELFFQP